MKREIICHNCKDKLLPMHPEDAANGMQRRIVKLRVRKPAGHGLVENGKFRPLGSLLCDHCCFRIPDGDLAWAVTSWFDTREGEPRMWEEEFLSPEP